jgi:membrane-associated phospholipid phosphatase
VQLRLARRLERPATAVLLGIGFILILLVSKVESWDAPLWAVLLFLCLDVDDDKTEVPWPRFLPLGLLLLGLFYWMYRNAAATWWKVADWQLRSVYHYFKWDEAFARIPLNDPLFLRKWLDHPWLTKGFTWVYGFGFAFSMWAAVIRSFAARDWRKMLRYALATYVLQTPLIIPFYNSVELHEVWWVMGRPDPLNRPSFLSPDQVLMQVQNCFPSMHTSIAFAVMLLALREKGWIFRWGMTAYTSAVIFSTLYLQIHWTIDVLAGLLFGYGVVKLTDLLMDKLFKRRSEQAVQPMPVPVAQSGS